MSFGFSVGDFATIGQLCWNLSKACKAAAGEYDEISRELGALHVTLKNLEEEAANPMSILNRRGVGRKADMDSVLNNIKPVLEDLEKRLLKYNSLGKMEKRKWDRLRFGAVDLDNVRGKLAFHISVIDLFMNSLSAGSLARIETALEEIMFEIKAGRRARSVLSIQDEGADNAAAWKELKADLLDSGVSTKDIEKHKDSIRSYTIELMAQETGGSSFTARGSRSSSVTRFLKGGQDPTANENWDSISQRGGLEKNGEQEHFPTNVSTILLTGVCQTETQAAASPTSPPEIVNSAAADSSMTATPPLTAYFSSPRSLSLQFQSVLQQNSTISEDAAAASVDEQSHTRATDDFLRQSPETSPFEKFAPSPSQFSKTELVEKLGESDIVFQEMLEPSNVSMVSSSQGEESNTFLNPGLKFDSIQRPLSNSGKRRQSHKIPAILIQNIFPTDFRPRPEGSRYNDTRRWTIEKSKSETTRNYDEEAVSCIAAVKKHRPAVNLPAKESNIEDMTRDPDYYADYNTSDEDRIQNEETAEARSARSLLQNGFDINQPDFNLRGAFFWAVSRGHEAIVRLLLEKGAEVYMKDALGMMPLHCAALEGHEAMVQLLLEKGADIEAKVKIGADVLLHGIAKHRHELTTMPLLIKKGAGIGAMTVSKDGRVSKDWTFSKCWTVLHIAAFQGHEAIVRLLLKKGADIEVMTFSKGWTVLHIAAFQGHEAIVRLLLKKGANIEAKNELGPELYRRTALHHATECGREAVVRLLLEKGAIIGSRKRMLRLATEGKHDNIVKLLEQQPLEPFTTRLINWIKD